MTNSPVWRAANCDEACCIYFNNGGATHSIDPTFVANLMKQIDWTAITKDVERQVLDLAKEILGKYLNEVSHDVKGFLEDSRISLERWSMMLAQGEINKDEFQFLVKGQLDVAELHALKQAGLAKVQLDLLVKGVVNILTEVVMSTMKVL